MNILLTGASGLLGSEFQKILPRSYAPTSREMDITNLESVQHYCQDKDIDLIIHCAAYTAVDKAESDHETCHNVNVQGVKHMLSLRIPIIHFSTDYVFDAPAGLDIPEDFDRHPLNHYGQTKYDAEKTLESSEIPFWNIRTTWLFGQGGNNFIKKILKKSETTQTLSVIDDQIGRPTFAPDLAQFVKENFLKKSQKKGHYHIQNTGRPVSWFDLAHFALTQKGWKGVLQKKHTQCLCVPAKRPKNSCLKNTKLSTTMRNWEMAVQDYIRQYH